MVRFDLAGFGEAAFNFYCFNSFGQGLRTVPNSQHVLYTDYRYVSIYNTEGIDTNKWYGDFTKIKAYASVISDHTCDKQECGDSDWLEVKKNLFSQWLKVVESFINEYGRNMVPHDIKGAMKDVEINLGLPVTFPNAVVYHD